METKDRRELRERSDQELRVLRTQFDRDAGMEEELLFVELEQQRRRNRKGF